MWSHSYWSFLISSKSLFREIREMLCFYKKSYVCLYVARATCRTIRTESSRFRVEISLSSFARKAPSETINLAHPNGSSTVNAIAQRHSAFRSSGGFSRDDEPPKSVWLSTLAFFSSPSYVLISFSHALVSDCRLYSLSVIKRLASFLFFFHSQCKSLIYIKEVKYISYLSFLL